MLNLHCVPDKLGGDSVSNEVSVLLSDSIRSRDDHDSVTSGDRKCEEFRRGQSEVGAVFLLCRTPVTKHCQLYRWLFLSKSGLAALTFPSVFDPFI